MSYRQNDVVFSHHPYFVPKFDKISLRIFGRYLDPKQGKDYNINP